MRWAVGFVLVGCSYSPARGVAPTDDDAALPDTNTVDIDAPPGETCLGSGAFRVCVPTPTMPFAVTGTANTGIDTDDDPPECTFVDQPNGRPSLCVLAATTITVDANVLLFSGTHPAVLFATESISIGRGVDVGSHQNGQAHGAGADSASCDQSTNGGSDNGGGGGGAGGSFGAKGGNGGAGGDGNGQASSAGEISTAAFLRGGCPGGNGGNGMGGGTGGNGNRGGGAILLLSPSIRIGANGFINASGGGGNRGTATNGGGGGGGSGGMIAMDGEAIVVNGTLVANGGGGGGGANNLVSGQSGFDPDPTDPFDTANGGSGAGAGGGNGAAGATETTNPGNSPPASDGAGGAGGGLGVIRILSGQSITCNCSPAPSP